MYHQCQLFQASHEYHVTTKCKNDANYFYDNQRKLGRYIPSWKPQQYVGSHTKTLRWVCMIIVLSYVAFPPLNIAPSFAFSHQKSKNLVPSLYPKKLSKILYVKYKDVKIPNLLRGWETVEEVIIKWFKKLLLAIVNVHLLQLQEIQ